MHNYSALDFLDGWVTQRGGHQKSSRDLQSSLRT
jgi:hypothetical protein